VEENGHQPFFLWRKMDNEGKRYLVFEGKWNHPKLRCMNGGANTLVDIILAPPIPTNLTQIAPIVIPI